MHDKEIIDRVYTKMQNEVGWTVEEYYEKLKQRAKKEKFPRNLMTLEGWTEDMFRNSWTRRDFERHETANYLWPLYALANVQ